MPPQRAPYLNDPPPRIDISVGRSLFVDDYLVESVSSNLSIIHHAAAHRADFCAGRRAGRGVAQQHGDPSHHDATVGYLKAEPTTQLQPSLPYPGFAFWPGLVRWEDDRGLFRMFFSGQTFSYDGRYKRAEWGRPLLDYTATSADGWQWVNVTRSRGVPLGDAASVFFDRTRGKYWMLKTTNKGRTTMRFDWVVARSTDGVRWREQPRSELSKDIRIGDKTSIFHNPFRGSNVLATRVNLYGVRGVSYTELAARVEDESFEWRDECLDFIEFGSKRRPQMAEYQRARCWEQTDGPELSRWRWWVFPDLGDEPYDFPLDRTPQGVARPMWSGNPKGPHLKRTKDMYGTDCFAYESLMMCYLQLHLAGNIGHYKTVRIELLFSRDGYHYARTPPAQRRSFLPMHTPCPANDLNVTWIRCELAGGGPAIVNEKLLFHASCFEPQLAEDLAPQMRNEWHGSRTFEVFEMRRDGFASVVGSGELITRLLTAPVPAGASPADRGLFINGRPTAPGGQVVVEVLSAERGVLWAHAPMSEDSTRVRLALVPFGTPLALLWPTSFRLRFVLRDFELFSFWVAGDAGRSNGHFTNGGLDYPHGRG